MTHAYTHSYTYIYPNTTQFALVRMHTFQEEHAKAEALLEQESSIKSTPTYLFERAILKEQYYVYCLNTFMDLGTLLDALDQAVAACEVAAKAAVVGSWLVCMCVCMYVCMCFGPGCSGC